MFSYSFLEDIVHKVNFSKNKLLEGFDAGSTNITETINDGNGSQVQTVSMNEFKSGHYTENEGSSVYFPELHNISNIDGALTSGDTTLKNFDFKTTTINSRLEFRFQDEYTYNRYKQYLTVKNNYLTTLNNIDKEIDDINEEISKYRVDQRENGQRPDKYVIDNKRREIAIKTQQKDQENVKFEKEKKKYADIIDTTYCKNIGDSGLEECTDFKQKSFKVPYFKIIGEEMTVNVGDTIYTSRDQKNYIIRHETSTKINEDGGNGFGLLNRWAYYSNVGSSVENTSITGLPSGVIGELVLKFVNKDYIDELDEIDEGKKYSFTRRDISNIEAREEKLKTDTEKKEKYVVIILPIFKTLTSNSNGIEVRKIIDNLFTGQQMSESTANISTALVNFSKFIPYEQPYYYYDSTIDKQGNVEGGVESEYGNGMKGVTHILFLNSSLHIIDPSSSNIMPVHVNNTVTKSGGIDVKINKNGLKNLDLENNNLGCNEISKKGDVIVERRKQATADSKIMNFTEQMEELQKNFYGQVLLGVLFCLIAYSMYFMFIKISFLASSKSGFGKDVAGQSKRFVMPKNTAFDVLKT